jgi:hypothetical protein
MKEGLLRCRARVSSRSERTEARFMLHAGLDVSRRRLDVCLLDERGEVLAETAVPPDADGSRGLAGPARGGAGAGGDRVDERRGLCTTRSKNTAGRC